MLYILLVKKLGDFGTVQIKESFLKVAAASVAMAIAIKGLMIWLGGYSIASLALVMSGGIVVFFVASFLFGVKEIKDPIEWFRKRR